MREARQCGRPQPAGRRDKWPWTGDEEVRTARDGFLVLQPRLLQRLIDTACAALPRGRRSAAFVRALSTLEGELRDIVKQKERIVARRGSYIVVGTGKEEIAEMLCALECGVPCALPDDASSLWSAISALRAHLNLDGCPRECLSVPAVQRFYRQHLMRPGPDGMPEPIPPDEWQRGSVATELEAEWSQPRRSCGCRPAPRRGP